MRYKVYYIEKEKEHIFNTDSKNMFYMWIKLLHKCNAKINKLEVIKCD